MSDPGFLWEFVGKVGAPIFAATLVGWLLSDQFALLHGLKPITLLSRLKNWDCEDMVKSEENDKKGFKVCLLDLIPFPHLT